MPLQQTYSAKWADFPHIKTLLEKLRAEAGGIEHTITLDGGDTWQGSASALWTRGMEMVEASNLLQIDAMTGHWEFTYSADEVLKNISQSNAHFLGQNVRIKEEALFEDEYASMTDRAGHGMFDEDNLLPFNPYIIKHIKQFKIAVIGQCFPRTGNANPQSNFPDWSFGLREEALQALVEKIRSEEKPAAVILLSHNGMDVDIKMMSRVRGVDAVLGGHTHDGVPVPIKVKNAGGGTTWVMNSGSSGKFVGVLDLRLSKQGIEDMRFKLLPVFSRFIKADQTMQAFIDKSQSRIYNKNVVESKRENARFNSMRLGKTYKHILEEELATSDETLYRRCNILGTWDQVILDALREEHDAQIALSPGVRWGTSVPAGQKITMQNVFDQTAITYGETYSREITGAALRQILEGVAENLFVADPYLQSGGDMVRVGGLHYTIDPTASYGSRIGEMRLENGQAVKDSKNYSLAGWAQVDSVGEGKLIWDVVADYLRGKKHLQQRANNYPSIKNVENNPGIQDYAGKLL